MVSAEQRASFAMSIPRAAVLLLVLVGSGWQAHAQATFIPVPACGDDFESLEHQLAAETDPKYLLRAAASGGDKLIPALRKLSKPNDPFFTIPGAAQVALARLGDVQSLDELQVEIQGKQAMRVVQAVEKLARVRSYSSGDILMRYVAANESNPHRVINSGDVTQDPIIEAMNALIGMAEDPPFTFPFIDKMHLEAWKNWWKTDGSRAIVPIVAELPDDKSRCLGRLADSGFPDAVRDLYLYLGSRSMPALRHLAKLSNESKVASPFQSVSGVAQLTLAKAGDDEQFDNVAKGLDDLDYEAAITKMKYIATPQAFEALLHSLTLTRFPKYRYYAADKSLHFVGEKLQVAVMAALSQMVVHPPLPPDAPPTETNIAAWTSWWVKNRDQHVLREVPF